MLATFNQELFFFFFNIGNSSSVAQMLTIFFAEWFPYLVLTSIILYESFHQKHDEEIVRTILRTSVVLIFTWFVALSLKHVFPSPRPFAYFSNIIPLVTENDPFGSFPSAHATMFGAVAGIVYANKFLIKKWYLLAAIIIALARVCAGVHWPIDVFVGLCIGFAFAYLLTALLLFKKK